MNVWTWIRWFFGNQTAATWVGSGLVAIGLVFTGCQIKAARQSLQANTLYSVEKDFRDLMGQTQQPDFVGCFLPKALSNPLSKLPSDCSSTTARRTLFELLVFYRMLDDLMDAKALTRRYYEARIAAACPAFSSPNGANTLREFNNSIKIKPSLGDALERLCGIKL